MGKNIKNTSAQSVAVFEVKVSALKKFVMNDPYLKNKISDYTYDTLLNQTVVFLSVCDTEKRAEVFPGIGNDLNEAWENAAKKAREFVSEDGYKAVWLKADVVCECEIMSYSRFRSDLMGEREFFYKKGVSFDMGFRTALLSEQINGTGVYNPKKRVLSLKKLRDYYASKGINCFHTIPKSVISFGCMGYICDSDKAMYKLYPDKENYGRRIVRKLTADTIKNVIQTSSVFLSRIVKENGQFVYGINPVNNDYFTTYNVLRHTGTIWSLIMQYDTTRDESLVPKIESTINFMVDCIAYRDKDTAFLVEKKSNEIKLGGNAVVVITLSTYMDIFKSDKYKELVRKVANGIAECQESDGSYYHILSYPDFARKAKDRIVYYDGEATFALARAYSVTGDERYLRCAEKALDYFIDHEYERYRDHWIAYSVNEVTMHEPLEKYLNFGLKNADVNLGIIYNQDTTFHTFLELLMAAFELYERIRDNNLKASYLEKFDFNMFIRTIFRRAHYMLNGYLYPEIAMYMECPKDVVNTFCVRHDSFRVRIDDVQHYIGGYYKFYKHFDRLNEYYDKIIGEPIENNSDDEANAEEQAKLFKAWIMENI